MKLVMYNGRSEVYYVCADPKILTPGRVYEVVGESVELYHTEYTLDGVKGEFNSTWFEDVSDISPKFVTSHEIPQEGKALCYDYNVDKVAQTSKIRWVEILGKDTYKVVTQRQIYIVTVVPAVNVV